MARTTSRDSAKLQGPAGIGSYILALWFPTRPMTTAIQAPSSSFLRGHPSSPSQSSSPHSWSHTHVYLSQLIASDVTHSWLPQIKRGFTPMHSIEPCVHVLLVLCSWRACILWDCRQAEMTQQQQCRNPSGKKKKKKKL